MSLLGVSECALASAMCFYEDHESPVIQNLLLQEVFSQQKVYQNVFAARPPHRIPLGELTQTESYLTGGTHLTLSAFPGCLWHLNFQHLWPLNSQPLDTARYSLLKVSAYVFTRFPFPTIYVFLCGSPYFHFTSFPLSPLTLL